MMKFKTTLLAGILALACGSSAAKTIEVSQGYGLDFRTQNYTRQSTVVNGQTVAYRAYENIVYVANPADSVHQAINIYIPEAYFNGGSINGYTAQTAPIFLPNQIGGYVVAAPGARGRTAATGKAPAAIVDLKAAVRYLRFNDAVMAGDAEKIISNGTSAGGALSVLLGASGNQADYEPYLQQLGAAPAKDHIFAVSAYCPISILDHADAAYEWQFNGVNDYQKMDISMIDYHVERKLVNGTLTNEQIQISGSLKAQFPAYVNSLRLRDLQGRLLRLDAQGNGSFKNYVASFLRRSAQSQLDAGKDLSSRNWLTIRNGKVSAVDFAAYARATGRQKTPPAFDALDLSSGENQLFGTATTDKQHFTAFSYQHRANAQATLADPQTVKLMNPMHYISRHIAPQHWRIRVGTADSDTSLAIAAILTAKLQNSGKRVDFALPWDVPHSGDYDLDELFDWMDKTVRRPRG